MYRLNSMSGTWCVHCLSWQVDDEEIYAFVRTLSRHNVPPLLPSYNTDRTIHQKHIWPPPDQELLCRVLDARSQEPPYVGALGYKTRWSLSKASVRKSNSFIFFWRYRSRVKTGRLAQMRPEHPDSRLFIKHPCPQAQKIWLPTMDSPLPLLPRRIWSW